MDIDSQGFLVDVSIDAPISDRCKSVGVTICEKIRDKLPVLLDRINDEGIQDRDAEEK